MSEWDIFGCNQVAADGGLKYHKVNGEENPSDACTKHVVGERLRKLVARVGQCQRSGRVQESLRVQPARTAPADSPGCPKHQDEGECQHISTPSTGLSPGCDPVAVCCAKTLARLQKASHLLLKSAQKGLKGHKVLPRVCWIFCPFRPFWAYFKSKFWFLALSSYF